MKHPRKIHCYQGYRFLAKYEYRRIFNLVNNIASQIGDDARWGVDRHFPAFFMLIISNKINELAIIQRSINEWKGLPLDMRLINFRAIIG
jgi:hypothetical protein